MSCIIKGRIQTNSKGAAFLRIVRLPLMTSQQVVKQVSLKLTWNSDYRVGNRFKVGNPNAIIKKNIQSLLNVRIYRRDPDLLILNNFSSGDLQSLNAGTTITQYPNFQEKKYWRGNFYISHIIIVTSSPASIHSLLKNLNINQYIYMKNY